MVAPTKNGFKKKPPKTSIHLLTSQSSSSVEERNSHTGQLHYLCREKRQRERVGSGRSLFESHHILKLVVEESPLGSDSLAINITHDCLSGWLSIQTLY